MPIDRMQTFLLKADEGSRDVYFSAIISNDAYDGTGEDLWFIFHVEYL